MRRVSPALHFLILGALGVAASRWLVDGALRAEPARARIEIGAERVETLRAGWLARTGEPPSGPELRALVEAEIDDAVLFAEACARGLEAGDPVTRARLARNIGFLAAADERFAAAGDARQVDEALALGLARGDLVVRRRLVERMRAELAARSHTPASEAEIAARLAREPERFASPARVRLSHVFLSRDRRGAALPADAARLRAQIAAEGVDAERAVTRGDAFLLGHAYPPRTEADLARDLGGDLARAAFALVPGRWSEPIPSSYGLHLVLVHERYEALPASLAGARARIRQEISREREARALRSAVDALRARYDIHVGEAGS